MAREQIKQVLAEMAANHDGVMEKLAALKDADLAKKVPWGGVERPVRFLLSQIGNHDREHGIQVVKNLQWMDRDFTEAQMSVAKLTQARGELVGLLAAVDDEDLDRVPKEGEWTIRQTLQHIIDVQKRYYSMIEKGLE
ncbi:MAG: DinB family protein [Dehalococcoidia bacterium]|nr:DinB family protein [Dehalococcoidia bacterium]